jgi:hypothetical protein
MTAISVPTMMAAVAMAAFDLNDGIVIGRQRCHP